MYKIAICDDDEDFLKELEEQIKRNPEFTGEMKVECFDNGEDLLSQDVNSYTLVIIDMCINTTDGFSVAKKIREENPDAVIIFCSGVVEPKPEHFEVQPYRYMVKQTKMEKADHVVSESLRFMKQKYYKRYINIASDGKAMKIDISRVLFFYTIKRGTMLKIQTEDEKEYMEIRSNQSMKEWHTELLQNGFEYPSKSYLVNMSHVRSIYKNLITMDDETKIQISRLCRQTFIDKFALFFDKKYRREVNQ